MAVKMPQVVSHSCVFQARHDKMVAGADRRAGEAESRTSCLTPKAGQSVRACFQVEGVKEDHPFGVRSER